MILTVVWMAVSLAGLLTQGWLFRWSRLALANVERNTVVADVARTRVRVNLVRVLCFAVSLGLGVYAIEMYRPPWFATSPVGDCLVVILLGFAANGWIELFMWRRIASRG